MDPTENFPRLHEFLTKFLGRFWPEVSRWSDRLSGCRISIESFSYSQVDGSNHGVFTTVLLQLFPRANSAKYAESGNVFNTNHGMFIFTVGMHGQIDEIEMYFSTPQAPPFFEELIPFHPHKRSQRFSTMVQEACAAGAWTCDEFMDSIVYKPMHVVDMDEWLALQHHQAGENHDAHQEVIFRDCCFVGDMSWAMGAKWVSHLGEEIVFRWR